MTAKKAARPLKKPARPALKPAALSTFEQRTGPLPRLQLVARPEPEAEAAPAAAALPGQLSDKDVILRLVEVLKGL